MEQASETGLNRTGIRTAPRKCVEMLEVADPSAPVPEGPESASGLMREEYIGEAAALGSVPPPPTLKGALKLGAQMLKGDRPQLFIDKLAERLAFERSGTRLYDLLIGKCRAADGMSAVPMERLVEFRDAEMRHFKLAAAAVERLGADPTVQTPSADLVGIEGMGWVQVLSEPRTSLAQALHAVLQAELSDVAGWDTLIMLAGKFGQEELAQQFMVAHEEEERHLEHVKQWYEQLIFDESRIGGA